MSCEHKWEVDKGFKSETYQQVAEIRKGDFVVKAEKTKKTRKVCKLCQKVTYERQRELIHHFGGGFGASR